MTGRILLDLTTSYQWRGRNAVGISRTERALALRLLADTALVVVPFRFEDGTMLPLAGPETHDLLHGTARPLFQVNQERKKWWRPGRLFLSVLPISARPPALQVLIRLRSQLRAVRRRLSGRQTLIPQHNDVLFTCGAGWEHLDWRVIGRLRTRTGARILSFCHDIIPMLSADWNPASDQYFEQYFLGLIDHSDVLICNSKATQRDILAFAAQHSRVQPATQVVLLGSELPVVTTEQHNLPQTLVARLRRGRFALAVGTFEVRKNYGLLLDIWDRLTQDPEFDLDLVIVGMRGWLADQVIRRLEASELFENRIFWLTDANDAALSWLYRVCHVVLFPSLYEGWGLPVVEALQYGRRVIATDRGAVPEAGLGVATIIDPDDLDSWCDAVAVCARDPRVNMPAVAAPTWDAAGAAVSGILRQFVGKSEASGDTECVHCVGPDEAQPIRG